VIETIRAECLDWTVILGRGHLVGATSTVRSGPTPSTTTGSAPHRALALALPLAGASISIPAVRHDIRRRDLLGGLIHEYHGAAA